MAGKGQLALLSIECFNEVYALNDEINLSSTEAFVRRCSVKKVF